MGEALLPKRISRFINKGSSIVERTIVERTIVEGTIVEGTKIPLPAMGGVGEGVVFSGTYSPFPGPSHNAVDFRGDAP